MERRYFPCFSAPDMPEHGFSAEAALARFPQYGEAGLTSPDWHMAWVDAGEVLLWVATTGGDETYESTRWYQTASGRIFDQPGRLRYPPPQTPEHAAPADDPAPRSRADLVLVPVLARDGARLRALRVARQLTQADLAERAWGSRARHSDIAALEAGRRRLGRTTARALAPVLGVSIGALFGDL